MPKFRFTREGGPWSYPAQGIARAVLGDVIESTLAIDAWWEPTAADAVVTIPAKPSGGIPAEPKDGAIGVWDRKTNAVRFDSAGALTVTRVAPRPFTRTPGATGVIVSSQNPLAGGAGVVREAWHTGPFSYFEAPSAVYAPQPLAGCQVKPTGGSNPQTDFLSFTGMCSLDHLLVVEVSAYAAQLMQILVDRAPVAAEPFLVSGSNGESVFITLNPVKAGVREITLILPQGLCFIGVWRQQAARLEKGRVPKFTAGLHGDSYTEVGVDRGWGLAAELFLLTGWKIAQLGQGGTGLTTDGGGASGKTAYGSPSRLAAIAAAKVDILLTIGSYNDRLATAPAVAAAAFAFWSAVAPTPTFALGVEPLRVTGPSVQNQALIDTAALLSHVTFIDWYGEAWLTGTGHVGAPTGNGNQDYLIGVAAIGDVDHPNYAGVGYIAPRIVESLPSVGR